MIETNKVGFSVFLLLFALASFRSFLECEYAGFDFLTAVE